MRLQVDLPDLSELVSLLAGEKLNEGVREAVSESTAVMLNRIRTRFLQQVDSAGNSWEPSYAAFARSFAGKGGRGAGGGTLFDTGTLFNSIQLYSVSPFEGAIATDVPYAPFHNFGIGQEVREFMGIGDADETLILNVFMKKLDEAFK